jgi:hypothetical protein
MNTSMNTFVRKMRARNAQLALQRAIDTASTPALRDELLTMAQRDIG